MIFSKQIVYFLIIILLFSLTVLGQNPCADCDWDEPVIEVKPKNISSSTKPPSENNIVKKPPLKPLLMMEWKIVAIENKQSLAIDPSNFTFYHTGSPQKSATGFRLEVKVNQSGYLYIVNQDANGDYEVIFPSSLINKGKNQVIKNQVITIPESSNANISDETACLHFEGESGTDTFFLIFSRDQIESLQAAAQVEYLPISQAILEKVKASTNQKLIRKQNLKEKNLTRVINNNRNDNSDLLEAILIKHTDKL